MVLFHDRECLNQNHCKSLSTLFLFQFFVRITVRVWVLPAEVTCFGINFIINGYLDTNKGRIVLVIYNTRLSGKCWRSLWASESNLMDAFQQEEQNQQPEIWQRKPQPKHLNQRNRNQKGRSNQYLQHSCQMIPRPVTKPVQQRPCSKKKPWHSLKMDAGMEMASSEWGWILSISGKRSGGQTKNDE